MLIQNKRASFDYSVLEKFEAGIELNGPEVSAIRAGRVNLTSAYGKILGGQVYLVNASITLNTGEAVTRSRRLLLHKNEVRQITNQLASKKLTLVPFSLYNKGHLIKLELCLCTSKKLYQKREVLKKRDIARNVERELRDDKY